MKMVVMMMFKGTWVKFQKFKNDYHRTFQIQVNFELDMTCQVNIVTRMLAKALKSLDLGGNLFNKGTDTNTQAKVNNVAFAFSEH